MIFSKIENPNKHTKDKYVNKETICQKSGQNGAKNHFMIDKQNIIIKSKKSLKFEI